MAQSTAEEYVTEVENFLDTMFEGQKGYVYTPTKSDTGFWQQYFFKWPEKREQIITHILTSTKDKDVYVAPSLFKTQSDKKPAWKGSHYVWIEFDGNAPDHTPDGIPEPTIRIQSSTKGHEHWYWRLNSFESDYRVIEGLSKRLTYTLDADKSGWDSSQVLRPPGTIHQDSKKRVRVLSFGSTPVGITDFKNLVTAPEAVIVNTTIDSLPDVQDVVGKYKWPSDATDLFKKPTIPVGSRSSAMTRLGFHCIEMGMTNEEAYVILYNADERWKKFATRSPEDRAKRLIGIITHCRSKKQLDEELRLSERETFVNVGDFRATDLQVKWLFTNLLAERGLGIISSAPGIGKSTVSIRLGMSVVLAKDFLIWESAMDKGKRVGFASLEMAALECKKFLDDMWPSFTDEEKEIIEKNFFILPLGYSLNLASKEAQQMILDEVDKHEIDFLIIDSLKASTGLDEKRTDAFFDWVNKYLRNDRGCSVWIVHHNRKPPNEGPRKPKDLSDLYGDTFIGAHPTTVLFLWKRSKNILEVLCPKIRLAEETDPFTVKRDKYLNFTVLEKTSIHDEEPGDEDDGDSSKDSLFN